MTKKIITVVLSLMILIFASASNACEFRVGQFGDPKEKIKIEPVPLAFPDRFGGENLVIPMEDLCKNDQSLYGTTVIYLYIENKLTQIRLERPNMNDKKLMDYVMKKYGSFNLPEGVSKEAWRGSYNWEIGNEYIEYIATNIHDGEAEILEITSKLYANAMAEYNEKVGKWLDSQK